MDNCALKSPYAPIRLRETTWWQGARSIAQRNGVLLDGRIRQGVPELIQNKFIKPNLENFEKNFRGHVHFVQMWLELLVSLSLLHQWIPLIAQYEVCGRQIFDLADAAVLAFTHTDVKDATLEDLELPYEAFFIRIGPQLDISGQVDVIEDKSAGGGYHEQHLYIDGVFVARTASKDGAGRLTFGLTNVLDNGEDTYQPGLFLDLTAEEQKLPCLQAVEASIARRAARLLEVSERKSVELELNSDFATMIRTKHQIAIAETAEYFRKVLPLVLNCIMYVESVGRNQAVSPGRDVPPDRVVEWMHASPQRRQKLRSALTRDGYTTVRLIGTEYEKLLSHGSGDMIAAHWRRGHVRMQPYGPGRTLKKRIRIDPIFVNARGTSLDEPPGHRYVTTSNSKQ